MYLYIFFTIAGALGIYSSILDLKHWKAFSSWPQTEGTIIHSQATETFNKKNAIIFFDYHVNGTRYKGRKVVAGGRMGGKGAKRMAIATELLSRYPLERKVMVHYSPSNPKVAYLEKAEKLKYEGLIVGPLFLIIAGLFIWADYFA